MSSTLPSVEVLLHEFYQPATPNDRKRDIESQLISFKSQPDAWQICLQIATRLEGTQFLWFFATSTLEHTVIRRWHHLSTSDRLLLRNTLWSTYASLDPHKVPRRQRDTFAQLIAIMGKREFPEAHPLYIGHCIELVKSKFNLGICLLRSTSEEVVSSREDVTTERKNYFHNCVSMCVPDIMDILTKYLLIVVCYINGKDVHSLPDTIMDYPLIATLPKDNYLSTSVLEMLECVQHYCSWMRTDLLTEYFLMSILDLAAWRPQHEPISLAAVSVLNELFYLQKPLPYVCTIMRGINGLLEQHNSVKQQSEMYGDKFRECLRLYASKYWPKLLQENDLLEAFLNSLYCCTVQKHGSLDFTEKLEIWTPIIKGLVENSKLNRYNDIIHQLINEIMRRILFESNKTELELLDNEIIEDHSQTTEWHQYLTQCIECIALVAESHPVSVYNEVYKNWSPSHVSLLSIEYAIDSGKLSDVIRKLGTTKFDESLKDFSTVCQALIRIAPMLYTNPTVNTSEITNHLQPLTENLVTILRFLVSNKINTLNMDRSSFQADWDYLYSQILISIKSVLMVSIPATKTETIFNNLFEALGSIFLTTNIISAPIIYQAASELLLCLSSVIRPHCLLETTAIINLMQAGPRLLHLPKQVIANIYISLISYLVLPWKNVEDQDYPRRTAVLKEYVESIAQSFLDMDLSIGESKVSSITLNLLDTLSLVVDFFRDSSNNVKQILASIMESIITKALAVYSNFGSNSNAIAITVADFSLSIIRSLQTQLGGSFIKNIVYLFISVSSREHLSVSRLAVVEKILLMFQLIVEQPGSAAMTMLPSILDFTIDHILPLLQHDNSIANNTEIPSLVYALFDSVLTCKWQYFYKSQVQHNGSLSSPANMNSENLHPGHFMAIMNAYGQVLVTGGDPANVRSVLFSMQQVNDRWRLYQRTLFKDHLLLSFQRAVLGLLLSGEGHLHYDLLSTTLYSLGQADTIKLRDSFVDLLSPVNNHESIDDICTSTDIPTFTQKLSQIMQDAHCVQMTQQN